MGIRKIPLARLEADLQATLSECADSGQSVVVELPGDRLVVIQPLEPAEGDELVNDLLASNPEFQALVAKSKASPRKPFTEFGL